MSNGTATFWVTIAAICAASGALHGILFYDGPSPIGIIYGTCIGVLVIAYERGVFLAGYSRRLRRLPSLAYLAAAEISMVVVILVAMALTGVVFWAFGTVHKTLLEAVTPKLHTTLFAVAASALIVTGLRVRDLIGSETFTNLILGRYHRPVSEERIFLFLDLVGSTAYAERHGDLAAQELLKAVFAAIAQPVRRYRGQIDDYVGDQVIVSWPIARGLDEARCVACVFAIRRSLAADRDQWIARFGLLPELRAALHGGSVVTAEVGVDRHKIAYFGDVMNATARLESLCRETGRPVLISDAVLARLPALPAGIDAEPLGSHRLRGRSETMVVHALAETAARETAGGRATAEAGLRRPVPGGTARPAMLGAKPAA
ncbi:adenylate/guanylate cyclase domain-containing protein [Methylobacterium nonmethylotrophicum]|uniref:Adenylate/guanylate cyclase domain-containing protein n=1 Tax=Methylobacterium nonmethylotrophicum TaxID=1141884 RepID=A0A4Z0NXJ4_9HYPH|nr:adenylate/guanylate cyclase domain-containing protein [Methylobacterium nonmethylotrophicum]TGE02387.1 adenylate/guanylate cyclase domain-containing protein [Methylobacterium nonmethylotrophicum]